MSKDLAALHFCNKQGQKFGPFLKLMERESKDVVDDWEVIRHIDGKMDGLREHIDTKFETLNAAHSAFDKRLGVVEQKTLDHGASIGRIYQKITGKNIIGIALFVLALVMSGAVVIDKQALSKVLGAWLLGQ